jgi:hypothetical protein
MMRSILAIGGLILILAAPVIAAEKGSEEGPPGAPRRQTEERPFGGPPPQQRSVKLFGKNCKAGQETCALEKKREVGTKCKCPGNRANGKVVQ